MNGQITNQAILQDLAKQSQIRMSLDLLMSGEHNYNTLPDKLTDALNIVEKYQESLRQLQVDLIIAQQCGKAY